MAELESFDDFIVQLLRETWDLFRRDALVYVIAGVLVSLLSVLSLGLIAGPIVVGFIELVRRGRRGETLALGLLFSRFDTFIPSLIAIILIIIAVTIGMCLLVVPGVLAALFSTYTLHVIGYEQASAIDAIRRSFALVRQWFLHTLVLVLLLSVAQAIGGAVFFGVLLTAPLSLIALTVGYERIAGLPANQVLTV